MTEQQKWRLLLTIAGILAIALVVWANNYGINQLNY